MGSLAADWFDRNRTSRHIHLWTVQANPERILIVLLTVDWHCVSCCLIVRNTHECPLVQYAEPHALRHTILWPAVAIERNWCHCDGGAHSTSVPVEYVLY